MGLFSNNRISSIAAIQESEDETQVDTTAKNDGGDFGEENALPEDDSSVKESAPDVSADNDETVKEEAEPADDEVDAPVDIDDDVMSMMDDEDNYDYDLEENYVGIIESCMNIHENDQNVFNALIGLDFMSVCKEHTLNEAGTSKEGNNQKCDKLNTNVEKVCVGAKKAMEQSVGRTTVKIEKLLEKDKRLNDKYAAVLKDSKNLEGFTGIKNFVFPNAETVKSTVSAADLSTISTAASKAISGIKKATDKAGVESVMKSFAADIDELGSKFKEDIHKAMKSNEVWTPSSQDLKVMRSYIGGKLGKRAMGDVYKKANSAMDKVEKEAKAAVSACCSGDEFGAYKAVKIYNVASAAAKILLKKLKVVTDLSVREIAAMRKAIIVCGNYAIKKSKGKNANVNEETIMDFCESSDQYVFDHFDE